MLAAEPVGEMLNWLGCGNDLVQLGCQFLDPRRVLSPGDLPDTARPPTTTAAPSRHRRDSRNRATIYAALMLRNRGDGPEQAIGLVIGAGSEIKRI